ncbi:MAG TPA: DUF2776 family protein [Gammaproteobacteria bacterium]|nr:DUF2776 family protein [Gammaproteobacteria bacterium]
MNYTISVLFRAIPAAMAALCVGYGLYCWTASAGSDYFVAGHVVTFLGAICLALFATAATIIRQLVQWYNRFYRWTLPIFAYLVAAATIAFGLRMRVGPTDVFVAGHVVFGLGLISACVATVATASTRFTLIPDNSRRAAGDPPPAAAFGAGTGRLLETIPLILAAVGWAWAIYLLTRATDAAPFIAGHVLAGLAAICTSLIALVASVVRQIRNTYTRRDARLWPALVVAMGTINIVWGIVIVALHREPYWFAPGFVLIGLGLICFSILSKVLLLALVWRRSFPLANRIPLIPVATALGCLFLAAFLFQAAVTNEAFFIPARVLVGLGAICFSLFSIVSILESGTSSAGGGAPQ